ncbi:MAG: MarR family transcriptional regulator [Rhodospirillales bacterium]|nr:MarR family transcriptional regulator [Rhodospirillales bacterium]
MVRHDKPDGCLSDKDYKTLAEIRAALRRFTHFSENAARAAGLTPQHHQALLAIRAAPDHALSIGELAEFLLIQPHSASELADRLTALALVSRQPGTTDRRMIRLHLTSSAEKALRDLSLAHRDELRRLRPLLGDMLARLE